MGKLTLAVLVLAVALGVYWFWWSDQGANSPITVEGTLSVTGVPGMQAPGAMPFTIQAVPGKLKVTGTAQDKTTSTIILLGRREMYIIDEKKKIYAQEEFDFVDAGDTELMEEMEETWPDDILERTAEWDYVGKGDQKWFCNKQTMKGIPKELMEKAQPPAGVPFLALFQTMLKDVKAEMWFTPDTRVGRRYFSMLNKLVRIREPGSGLKEQGKRPRFKYVNLDFFPIPMKATVYLGPARMNMEVKSLSREKIPKDAFEIPSGYNKVSMSEIGKQLSSNPGRTSSPAFNPVTQRRETPRFVVPAEQQPRQVTTTRTRRTTTRSTRRSGST